jgi:hypothetical protein
VRGLAHPPLDRVFATDAAITYINRRCECFLAHDGVFRALMGVSNVASGPPLTRFFEGRPHTNITQSIV